MTNPTCPSNYNCTFTLVHPRNIYHNLGPWWEHSAGWIVAIIGLLCLMTVLIVATVYIARWREDVRDRIEREQRRQHDLQAAEQKTLLADAAKGHPEIVKMLMEDK